MIKNSFNIEKGFKIIRMVKFKNLFFLLLLFMEYTIMEKNQTRRSQCNTILPSKNTINNSRRRNMKTHQYICYTQPTEERQKPIASEDLFRKFLYQDNVTKHRYEVESLKKKSTKRTQTLPNCLKNPQSQKNLLFLSQGLQLLQNIKETRNNDLMQEFKQINEKRRKNITNRFSSLSPSQIEQLKKKIRKQVFGLNKNFLRQYLYHQQPFNELIVDINNYSNSNIINEKRIGDMKAKIQQCMKKSNEKLYERTEKKKFATKVAFEVKAKKQKINRNIDMKFDTIWKDFESQISRKIKMQGEFNLKMK